MLHESLSAAFNLSTLVLAELEMLLQPSSRVYTCVIMSCCVANSESLRTGLYDIIHSVRKGSAEGSQKFCAVCSNRLGVRLLGPRPQFARKDGGEGGSHPSNVPDHIYALGTINFTGTHKSGIFVVTLGKGYDDV